MFQLKFNKYLQDEQNCLMKILLLLKNYVGLSFSLIRKRLTSRSYSVILDLKAK
jgi:hypothetical protein